MAFSNRFARDGILFTQPNEHLFSFNNPLGACPKCEGYGDLIGIDEQLVIPNTNLSLYEGAVAPWKGERMQRYKNNFIDKAYQVDFLYTNLIMNLQKTKKKYFGRAVSK